MCWNAGELTEQPEVWAALSSLNAVRFNPTLGGKFKCYIHNELLLNIRIFFHFNLPAGVLFRTMCCSCSVSNIVLWFLHHRLFLVFLLRCCGSWLWPWPSLLFRGWVPTSSTDSSKLAPHRSSFWLRPDSRRRDFFFPFPPPALLMVFREAGVKTSPSCISKGPLSKGLWKIAF